MKIDREDDSLIIGVRDIDSEEYSDFFYALRGIMFERWIDSNTVAYNTTLFSEETTARELRHIRTAATNFDVHITESADEIFTKYEKLLEEIELAERIANEKKLAEERAKCKVKKGCCLCTHLKWINGKPFCEYVGEYCKVDDNEVEYLFEVYKQTKIYSRPTPFPVDGCKFIEEARRLNADE